MKFRSQLPQTSGHLKGRGGQALVEFGMAAVVTVMLILSVVEFGRLVLVYTTVNNAARIGVRFAMVHGSGNPVGVAAVQTVVKSYLSAAAIDTATAAVNVSYPPYAALGCALNAMTPGCPVLVTVSYPYQTMVTYFPISVNLASQSEGVITF
jgi:Flp pilus assembly protein TadG